MKKVITTILALAMVSAMSINAFAATELNTSPAAKKGEGEYEIGVNAKYVDGISTGETVSVDIEWGKMEFTYSVGGTKEWNADSHTYTVKNGTSAWTESGNTITLTNHSNVDVKATFTYTDNANKLTGSFTYNNNKTADTNGAIALTKAIENNTVDVDNVTATLKLSGTPDSTLTDFTKVGKVTVKIAK